MEAYLEELDGARPQEENELVGGFRRVILEISSVRERVKQFKQQALAASAATPAAAPWRSNWKRCSASWSA